MDRVGRPGRTPRARMCARARATRIPAEAGVRLSRSTGNARPAPAAPETKGIPTVCSWTYRRSPGSLHPSAGGSGAGTVSAVGYFPWRRTREPWEVLLAELMLQRTRADLVVPVYDSAMRRYPTAAAFADAPNDDLADLLRPLGYHHRNARLRAAARACSSEVPRTMAGLMSVPGVGRYAATATLCFAYGRRLAVIDPSVIRVLARLHLGTSQRARPRDDPALWAAADQLLPSRGARE